MPPSAEATRAAAEGTGADGRRHQRFQVLTLCDGKIVDMQGFATRRQAERFARQG